MTPVPANLHLQNRAEIQNALAKTPKLQLPSSPAPDKLFFVSLVSRSNAEHPFLIITYFPFSPEPFPPFLTSSWCSALLNSLVLVKKHHSRSCPRTCVVRRYSFSDRQTTVKLHPTQPSALHLATLTTREVSYISLNWKV